MCLLGAPLAAAAAAGLLGGCTPLLVALPLLYLALIAPLAAATARGSSSSLPWAELAADGLLLEAAFAAALWAPLWPGEGEAGREEEEERDGQREGGEGGGGASEDGGSGGSSTGNEGDNASPSAPALAPAFLLRWIVAKNAFFRGLCRWKGIKGGSAAAAAAAVLSSSSSASSVSRPPSPAAGALSLVALVADVALAPLALSPARLPRLVAAAALLASWMIDVAATFPNSFSSSRSSSTLPSSFSSRAAAAAPPLWTLLLRPALVLPLFHAGLLDSGSSGETRGSSSSAERAGEGSKAKRAARLLVSAAAAVPALFSAIGVLSPFYSSSSSSFEDSLSKYAPYCLAAAGLTMLASLLADVLRSMSSASIGLLEGSEEEREKQGQIEGRRTQQQQRRQPRGRGGHQEKVQYVRGTHEPALVGAISLMLFCAGCLEVSSAVASPAGAAAAGAAAGCSGGPGCGGGPAALVVARRLSWLARPWRATGPSFASMVREEGQGGSGGAAAAPSAAAAAVAIEVRSECLGDGDDGGDEGAGGWTRVSPRSHSSRVAAALSFLFPRGGEGGEDGNSSSAPPPPWLDHLLYRLVSDPGGPVAASFAERQPQQQQQPLHSAAAAAPRPPPCAARAVFVAGGGGRGKRAWASFSAAEAADASSPASERLARHGWGPLVEYESPSKFGRAVADAVAVPRRVLLGGGGGAGGGEEGGGGFSVLAAGAGAACSLALSAAALAVVRGGRGGSPEATAASSSKKRD